MSNRYEVAERFKSVQGEGAWTGTPMAFIRFVGCSVGKKICHGCDTEFERPRTWDGGGSYTFTELLEWIGDKYEHVCLTGGEPFDQDLTELIGYAWPKILFHIETSGTKPIPSFLREPNGLRPWICVSPKPGFLEEVVLAANEIKVIVPGLGNGPGWPTLEDALRWADSPRGTRVYLQPRNGKHDVDRDQVAHVLDLVAAHPSLHASLQLHKLLRVR